MSNDYENNKSLLGTHHAAILEINRVNKVNADAGQRRAQQELSQSVSKNPSNTSSPLVNTIIALVLVLITIPIIIDATKDATEWFIETTSTGTHTQGSGYSPDYYAFAGFMLPFIALMIRWYSKSHAFFLPELMLAVACICLTYQTSHVWLLPNRGGLNGWYLPLICIAPACLTFVTLSLFKGTFASNNLEIRNIGDVFSFASKFFIRPLLWLIFIDLAVNLALYMAGLKSEFSMFLGDSQEFLSLTGWLTFQIILVIYLTLFVFGGCMRNTSKF